MKKKPVQQKPTASNASAAVNTSKEEAEPKVHYGWLNNNGIAVITAILTALLLMIFGDFIFGFKVFMFTDIGSDTYNFSYPFYYHVSEFLHRFEIPKWTFSQGLGQNIFPAHIGDLPNLISYFFSSKNIAESFIWVQLFKIFFSGIFFFLFLRLLNIGTYGSIMGALFYAGSGFVMIGSAWIIFTTEALYLSCLLYSIEQLRKNRNFILFPLAIGLVAAYNPVNLYLDTLFIASYLLLTTYKNGFDLKKDLKLFAQIIALAILGTGMSSFLMFGNLNIMIESPRGSGNVSLAATLLSRGLFFMESGNFYETFLLRLFSNDMAGYANSFKGWSNYLEAPMQYCGILSLLLLPQLFFLGKKKLKIAAAIALGIAVICVCFPFFRYAFWLFTGDYFRTFSLFFCTTQIMLAVIALQKIINQKKINLPVLFISFLPLAFIVLNSDIANESLTFSVIFFLALQSILLLLLPKNSTHQIALILLPIAAFIEISIMTNGTFNEREAVKKEDLAYRIGFNDYTNEAIAFIKNNDKDFYRIHKDYISSIGKYASFNNSLIQNYYGSASYSSFNQKYYVNFLQKMGVITDSSEIATRWIFGLNDRPLLKQLVSNKYMLLKNRTEAMQGLGYDSVTTINGIKIFKNRNFLPLGFTYSAVISQENMAKIPVFSRDIMIMKAAVLNDVDIKKYSQKLKQFSGNDSITGLTMEDYNNLISNLKRDTLHISSFEQNDIRASIELNEKKLLFLSIPYDKGWVVKINGKSQEPIITNYGFMGFMLEKGKHNMALIYIPPYYYLGMGISIISMLIYVSMLIYTRLRKDI